MRCHNEPESLCFPLASHRLATDPWIGMRNGPAFALHPTKSRQIVGRNAESPLNRVPSHDSPTNQWDATRNQTIIAFRPTCASLQVARVMDATPGNRHFPAFLPECHLNISCDVRWLVGRNAEWTRFRVPSHEITANRGMRCGKPSESRCIPLIRGTQRGLRPLLRCIPQNRRYDKKFVA